jgi:hypothetical protein
MLRRVAFVRTDILEERIAYVIKVRKIGELMFRRSVLPLLVSANVFLISPILVNLIMEAISFYQTSVIVRTTRRNIPEDGILHSHRRENLKSYIALTGSIL